MAKDFKFKLGADPEFNMELFGKRMDAKATLTNILSKSKTFEVGREGFKLKEAGTLGWDGHSSTGEIRPNPSNSPEGIVNNLREIFQGLSDEAPLFELSTLSRGAAIGGHIHFELPKGNISDERMKAIHKRLVSFYLPIIMGENKINLAIRIKGGYGKLCTGSAYRKDNKFTREDGSPGYTYELRCPSAEWTSTPKIANATLAYLGVVFHEIMKNPKSFEKTCKDIIIRTERQGDAIQELAMAEYTALTQTLYNKIKKYIKTFELYPEFKKEVDFILNYKSVLAEKQATNFEIIKGWNLVKKEKESPKKKILSEKEFTKRIKDKDLDVISKIINVAYNEDTNVDLFAQRLAQTMTAFNWDLNKHYFLYGVRKGINGYIVSNNTKATIINGDEIKTISDQEALDKLIEKMKNKAKDAMGEETTTKKLNFSSGKMETIKKEIILIGIPYQDRIENKTSNFIEVIYNVDKGEVKQPRKTRKELIDDTAETSEKGKIYQALLRKEKTEEILEDGVPDSGADERSQQDHIRQIEEEINEAITEGLSEPVEYEMVTLNAE